MDLEAFELVILRRAPDARTYDEETLERIQRDHLAYHASLRAAGRIVTNGPVRDHPDESIRGLTFYRTGSLEETRRLAEQDPAVQAGRLAVEVMTWWCPPGTMIRPGRLVSVPDP
ncbi:MAG: YciI family protein [Actinomycetota bacterium]|nr:YciI family protein [Actinomycetota bacterium]